MNSTSIGDPARFQTLEQLQHRLEMLASAPKDLGEVTRILRRHPGGERELLTEVELTVEGGLVGDSWGRDPNRDPQAQLAVMQQDVAELIANGQPLELSGDNLWLNLDLSESNLPVGTRLRMGAVLLEVSPLPHTGCGKFRARFGDDGLRIVAQPQNRHLRLRGIYLCVIVPGHVQVGTPVEVLSRPT